MDGTASRRVKVRYEGHVQGVGFRFTACALASGRPVTGYVRNEPDESVELVAEGSEGELRGFLGDLRRSSAGRWVVAAREAWGPATGEFGGFAVRH